MHLITLFAADESGGGLSALGLNWQAFLFQLISFVIVLLILRQFAYKKIIQVLDDRRSAVEKSIDQAAETEEKLRNAEKTIASMLAKARSEADDVIAASRKEAAQVVEIAEGKAQKRAEHIVAEAKSQMDIEVDKARAALRDETAQLVASATERIIKQKLDANKDAELIKSALLGAKEPSDG